jgi:hypothetical protein
MLTAGGSSVQSLTQRVMALEREQAQAPLRGPTGGGPVRDLPGLFSQFRGWFGIAFRGSQRRAVSKGRSGSR